VSLSEKNREVPKAGTRDMWQNHIVGLKNREADTSHFGRSQQSVDFSCLGDSRDKSQEFEG
jgi:hypothetical protein